MITDRMEKTIRSELNKRIGDAVDRIYTELQDDGETLLVMITPKSEEREGIAHLIEVARAEISPRVPPRRGSCSWMLAITSSRGVVVDAAQAEILL